MRLYIFSLQGANGKIIKLTFDNINEDVINYLNDEYSDFKKLGSESIEVGEIIDLKPKNNILPIFWSVEDFEAKAESMFNDLKDCEPVEFEHLDNWEQFYDKTMFPEQLERMINSHDANNGITWLTVEEYVGQCEIKNTKK